MTLKDWWHSFKNEWFPLKKKWPIKWDAFKKWLDTITRTDVAYTSLALFAGIADAAINVMASMMVIGIAVLSGQLAFGLIFGILIAFLNYRAAKQNLPEMVEKLKRQQNTTYKIQDLLFIGLWITVAVVSFIFLGLTMTFVFSAAFFLFRACQSDYFKTKCDTWKKKAIFIGLAISVFTAAFIFSGLALTAMLSFTFLSALGSPAAAIFMTLCVFSYTVYLISIYFISGIELLLEGNINHRLKAYLCDAFQVPIPADAEKSLTWIYIKEHFKDLNLQKIAEGVFKLILFTGIFIAVILAKWFLNVWSDGEVISMSETAAKASIFVLLKMTAAINWTFLMITTLGELCFGFLYGNALVKALTQLVFHPMVFCRELSQNLSFSKVLLFFAGIFAGIGEYYLTIAAAGGPSPLSVTVASAAAVTGVAEAGAAQEPNQEHTDYQPVAKTEHSDDERSDSGSSDPDRRTTFSFCRCFSAFFRGTPKKAPLPLDTERLPSPRVK